MLKDKVIIITGAAQGMGEAAARKFADYGGKIVVADFNEEKGQEVADDIKSQGKSAIFVKVDVSDEESVKNMIQTTVEEYGRLDGALNNAAITPDDKMIHEMDMDYNDRLMSVDLRGVALCLKYELAQMLDQGDGGSIVNTASVSGVRPQPLNPAYVTAKHGVIGLTKQAAMDYGEHGIRVNAVSPGAVDTPMLRGAIDQFDLDADSYAFELSVLGRFAQPEEIAEAHAWLLSDLSSYVTGVNLPVDGGYLSM